MQTATTIALTIVRFTGLVQVVLGALFWSGRAGSLVPVHMLLGFVLVLALWTLAGLAARAGAGAGIVAVAALWGLAVPAQGLTQVQLLPGDFHWLIRVLHLLVGLVAIGLGEGLAARIGRARTLPAPA